MIDKQKTLDILKEWFDAGMIMYENLPRLADEILSSQWISCEDRLPEKNQRVWVNYDGYSSHSGVRWDRPGQWDCTWWGDRWNDRDVERAKKRFDMDFCEITHWQPLLSAPEDGNSV